MQRREAKCSSHKIIVLKLINEEFAHAGLRNYAGVSKVCITYFYSDIVVDCLDSCVIYLYSCIVLKRDHWA